MSDWIVGRRPVLEALRKEKLPEKLYIQQGENHGSVKQIIAVAKEKGIVIQYTDQKKLDEVADGAMHQGVALLSGSVQYKSLEELFAISQERGEKPFFLILDGILDPHNYGAMIRTAEVVGCHGVIVPKRGNAPMSQTVHKASAGATQHMAICKVSNITDTILKLKKQNVWVFGADMGGEDYTKTNLTGAVAIVIGSEGKGLGEAVKKHVDGIVSLPVRGNVDSLNASNACAVLLYEVLRQNRG